jgi:hypothetical protein
VSLLELVDAFISVSNSSTKKTGFLDGIATAFSSKSSSARLTNFSENLSRFSNNADIVAAAANGAIDFLDKYGRPGKIIDNMIYIFKNGKWACKGKNEE